jgi:hypothetical protein
MQNAVSEFVAHGNAGRYKLVEQRLITRELQICSRLYNDAHSYTRAVPGNEGIGKLRKLDHVKGNVDAGGLFLNEVE